MKLVEISTDNKTKLEKGFDEEHVDILREKINERFNELYSLTGNTDLMFELKELNHLLDILENYFLCVAGGF